MRDANPITDLLFTIGEVEYSVEGIYLTERNTLYAKLKHPGHGGFTNFLIGDIQAFVDEDDVKIDVKPNSHASRDLISQYARKNLNYRQAP
jgi:hypothetical protein